MIGVAVFTLLVVCGICYYIATYSGPSWLLWRGILWGIVFGVIGALAGKGGGWKFVARISIFVPISIAAAIFGGELFSFLFRLIFQR